MTLVNNGDGMDVDDNADATQEIEEEEEEEEQDQSILKDVESFRWEIENFSKITERKIESGIFERDGKKWKLLMFPKGNNVSCLSIYIEANEHPILPPRWEIQATFRFVIVNQKDPKKKVAQEVTNIFNGRSTDWGFSQMIPIKDLVNLENGWIVDDKLIIDAKIKINREEYTQAWHLPNYNSRKATRFVGIKNQGATCYMNSLLQALFHLGTFRNAVFSLPTEKDWNDNPEKCIPLALQRLFWGLQYSENAVSTKELTKSFGWDRWEAFQQHDVQELNRVLCDNLEGKMKGTPAEGTIEKLFTGKFKNFIKCINVEYESSREEVYYDVQLCVKGCKNLAESFEKYCEVEMLDGENKYQAEGHGLQDAKKGCSFQSFPPVLQLQLKRFEYDPYRDANVKVNDKHSFPPVFDVAPFLVEDADKSVCTKYVLYGVLVHSGSVSGGHYYAFLKPTKEAQWYKFDDDKVIKVRTEEAIDNNFGGEDTVYWTQHGKKVLHHRERCANAYMLMYIRESDLDEILIDIQKTIIPEKLKNKFVQEREEAERKRKEKEEAHLYMHIKVIFEEHLENHDQTKFDLFDWDQEGILKYRIKKATTLNEFKQKLIDDKHVSVTKEKMRVWRWINRQNKTCRISAPYAPEKEDTPLQELKNHSEWKVLVEVSNVPEDAKEPFTPYEKDDARLFLKYYEPEKQKVFGLGSVIVKNSTLISEVLNICKEKANLPAETEVIGYEEIKPQTINALVVTNTLKASEIGTGDVIVFQTAESAGTGASMATIPDFYQYFLHRINVSFHKLSDPKTAEFTMELSTTDVHEVLSQHVGAKLGIDPMLLRFTGYNYGMKAPKSSPFKLRLNPKLSDMVMLHQSEPHILYYEILDTDVREIEKKKAFKIQIIDAKTEVTKKFEILVSREGTVQDLIAAACEEATMDPNTKLLVYEVKYSKIANKFEPETPINRLDENSKIVLYPLTDDDLPQKTGDQQLQIIHLSKEGQQLSPFGIPFFFRVGEEETVKEIMARIQARFEVSDEDFKKWQLIYIHFQKPETLDDDVVPALKEYNNFNYLGLQHVNKNPVIKYRRSEKPIKIYN